MLSARFKPCCDDRVSDPCNCNTICFYGTVEPIPVARIVVKPGGLTLKQVILPVRSIVFAGEVVVISAAKAHHPIRVSGPMAADIPSPSSPMNTAFP